jgi:hypothetical protein
VSHVDLQDRLDGIKGERGNFEETREEVVCEVVGATAVEQRVHLRRDELHAVQ